MGQIFIPAQNSIILSAVDRLLASNADGGLSPAASHIILLGEAAGQNLGALTDIIALGRNALDAGLADPLLNGSIAIGGNAASSLTTGASGPVAGADIVIGRQAAEAMQFGGGDVIIGDKALQNSPGTIGGVNNDFLVVIGCEAAQNVSTLARSTESVVIGYRALRSAVGNNGSCTGSVIIGNKAALNALAQGGIVGGCVVIGNNCANGIAAGAFSTLNSIFIGQDVGSTGTAFARAQDCVVIGSSISSQAVNGNNRRIVAIGTTIAEVGLNNNTLLGNGAAVSSDAIGCISIGHGAGTASSLGDTLRFVVEDFDGAIRSRVLYSDMGKGAIIVGNGVLATQDLPGTNLLKILNGTVTGVAPVGGGFFYSVAGELHWVSTGNVDYAITPSASVGTFTVATLPAAPAAGTKAYVTNALAPVFAAAAAGAGAIFTPVYFDGVIWRCG